MKLIKFRIYDPVEKRMIVSGATPTMLHSFFKATAVLNVRDGMEYQEFIGVLDKADKEIWEGNIVNYTSLIGNTVGQYVVEWYEQKCGFILSGINNQSDRWNKDWEPMRTEIIGDIYQNPELLDA